MELLEPCSWQGMARRWCPKKKNSKKCWSKILRGKKPPKPRSQVDPKGNVNVSNFAGRVPGVGGFADRRGMLGWMVFVCWCVVVLLIWFWLDLIGCCCCWWWCCCCCCSKNRLLISSSCYKPHAFPPVGHCFCRSIGPRRISRPMRRPWFSLRPWPVAI